jgi:shikimate O-hydroxycinnamoyltransferase
MGLNFKIVPFSTVVDLRRRMVPPLSERCVGNIIWFSSTHIDKKEMELPDLVCKIKQGLSEFCDVYPQEFAGKEKDNLLFISENLQHVNDSYSDDQTMLTFSSWCGFPIYEVDFGWGKPTWVTTFGCSLRNVIFMMDTRDGNGIEAFVNMEESDMARFENDAELLKYASLNPSNAWT